MSDGLEFRPELLTAQKALRILERPAGVPSSPLDTFYLPLLAA